MVIKVKSLVYYDRIKYNNSLLRPKMVSWEITNKCNLFCKHCLNNSGDSCHYQFEDELQDIEQIELAKQIAELRPEQFCLCGGETLLNKNIYEIINIVSSAGVMVNMVTNGTLITDSVAKKLKESGISHVQVSVDGLGCQHDIFRNTKGAFDKSIRGIRFLKENKIKVMVSCCPNKLNFASFLTYIDYLQNQMGVDCFRLMPLLPIGRAETECKDLFLNSYEYFNLVQKIIMLKKNAPNLNIEWGDPLEHLNLILLSKRKYPIVMSISSVGELTITPYIPIVLGTVRGDDLLSIWLDGYNKIWTNKDILNIIRKVKNIYDLSQFGDTISIEELSWRNISNS